MDRFLLKIPHFDFPIREMSKQRSPKQLAKLIDYILSRRPDEFGLVTDADGYIKIKELLKAVNEEGGLGYVRLAHLNEIMLTVPNHSFEISDKLIRSKYRDNLPRHSYAVDPPKLLYTCVRRKAYPHVHQKGIRPSGYSQVVLSSSRDMAERMGRRIDHSAVLLTIPAHQAMDQGVVFFQAGDSLFLAKFVPAQCFTGPPLPKEKPPASAPEKQNTLQQYRPAGSYFIDLDEKADSGVPKSKRRGPDSGRKKEGKHLKKLKRKREPPPWRK
jgi:putative RNA 2'-phosphotransferase